MKHQNGVTLIELMITLAIVTIILTSVGPSIQSILIKNRIVAEINELSALVQYARHQAIDEQTLVTVCPSLDYTNCTTDWNNPKMAFIDSDNNAIRGATEELIVSVAAASDANLITSTQNSIIFEETGQANNAVEILLCHKDKSAEYARSITITLQGRVKMSTDSDKNGIYENAAGTPLTC
ncbi:GspH/FimT family pseudopilin [Paraglaciecola aquimarina]|uniref:Type II secretion system protein H n=1 Tax=Paraglaciecola algarum TaxID=3050085 RepID=A0ABS9DA38_9ALTE|nr:GspH/FimT family pseudopilin [Paraglaciecola sp. G1-23]